MGNTLCQEIQTKQKKNRKKQHQDKGNHNDLKEEVHLLNEFYIDKEEKFDLELPIGVVEKLDRGGFTIPKKELLPYLSEAEHRIHTINTVTYLN